MSLPRLNRSLATPSTLPERILQFGGGNFLRAFAGELIDQANGQGLDVGRIVVLQSVSRDRGAVVAEQDGLCTILTRGVEAGQVVDRPRILTSVSRALAAGDTAEWAEVLRLAAHRELRIVLSNTTEAGIKFDGEAKPPQSRAAASFPGKLCQVLYARWVALGGAQAPGLAMVPCELIEDNGTSLRTAVLAAAAAWDLPPAFHAWVTEANAFCDTLVDRIVPGAPKDDAPALAERLGYDDRLLTIAEPYHLWAIRGPAWVRDILPLERVGNVVWTDDLPSYRTRKVRVLNGAHTAMAAIGRLAGLATVGEVFNDAQVGGAIIRLLEREVVPTLAADEGYVAAVLDRFRNPFLRHELSAISLNATAKWRVRLLPTLRDNVAAGRSSPLNIASLAALIAIYRGGRVAVQDEAGILAAWMRHAPDTRAGLDALLADSALWGQDIRPYVPIESLALALATIRQHGIRDLLKDLA